VKFVVDTNVLVVTNEDSTQANEACVLRCREWLENIRAQHQLILDRTNFILLEYKGMLGLAGKPGFGRSFFKWIFDHRFYPQHCEFVSITLRADREDDKDFEEFPVDPELVNFDRSDRKFVAVALAHPDKPPILNAVDTDWWLYHHALVRHGVRIEFLCLEAMA
jgi:hypothetical protein